MAASPKRDAAVRILLAHHDWANVKIASIVGCSDQTVGDARKLLEGAGLIPPAPRRLGSDGVWYGGPESRSEMAERFMDSVSPEPNTGCWLWMGTQKGEYGQFWDSQRKSRELAHRAAFRLFRHDFDDALCVCHSCDTPVCVNPGHLWLGTSADNNRDRDQKGRGGAPRGLAHGQSKLTPAEVLAIAEARGTGDEVAARFGISKTHALRIRRGESWQHLFTEDAA